MRTVGRVRIAAGFRIVVAVGVVGVADFVGAGAVVVVAVVERAIVPTPLAAADYVPYPHPFLPLPYRPAHPFLPYRFAPPAPGTSPAWDSGDFAQQLPSALSSSAAGADS